MPRTLSPAAFVADFNRKTLHGTRNRLREMAFALRERGFYGSIELSYGSHRFDLWHPEDRALVKRCKAGLRAMLATMPWFDGMYPHYSVHYIENLIQMPNKGGHVFPRWCTLSTETLEIGGSVPQGTVEVEVNYGPRP